MFKCYLLQQKLLQKILQKVFISTKFTQYKTSRTLNINRFGISDNKNIAKLFSKYDLFFLDQADFSSDRKIILTITINLLPLYLSNFSLPYFCVQPSKQSTPRIFFLPPFSQFRLRQGTRELGSHVKTDTVLISSLLPFFIQARKIVVLQVVVSDEDACSRNGKPSNPPSLILSTYCRYFYTLLIPLQALTFSWKPVA